ncbi:MAG: hypothetical protein ACPHLK_05220 [Gammaproteobacteria bacterium]|jgi:hypothetical protein
MILASRTSIVLLIFCKFILTSNIAFANILDKAEQLYDTGHFRDAAELARTIESAQAYSFAAKATLVEATFIASDKDKFALFQQAQKDANTALSIDQNLLDAHIQIAVAVGSIADLENPLTAFLSGYAKIGKRHLDIALSIAPDDSWVHGLLGIWHLQIVNRVSALWPGKLYDASFDEGLYHCNKAEQLENSNLQILYGCAISLYEFNDNKYKQHAISLLQSIVEQKPIDATESYIVQEARLKLNQQVAIIIN